MNSKNIRKIEGYKNKKFKRRKTFQNFPKRGKRNCIFFHFRQKNQRKSDSKFFEKDKNTNDLKNLSSVFVVYNFRSII